ncbi:MAG: HD domain-containing protein [Gemmatimonadales bacterium]|nr:MAG: HD domain-containing protein [Gemmatimonadales bacterium]
MSEAIRFLTSIAQALSTMLLYEDGHPARERALDAVHHAAHRLQERVPTPSFTILGDEILMDARPLRALRSWEWGGRLSRAGIQRLELVGPVERWDVEAFLEEVATRVSGEPRSSSETRHSRPTQIRYGSVGLTEETDEEESLATATMSYDLQEEVSAVEWIHQELKGSKRLNLLEAETIVRSLTVAMHGDQEFLIPLLRMKDFDQYTTTHAMNVAVLSMALAEYIGLGPKEVRSFGISGLLHDLGKVTVPDEILNKPGKLTEQEREVMNNHTVEGARLILDTEEHLDLAAVVAYEHHIKIDGTGYPSFKYPRKCHQASDLVHVCDVFDALRTHRPYRNAWGQDRVLRYLEEGVGSEFDSDLTRAFVRMMRSWEGQLAYVERPDQPVRGPGSRGSDASGPPSPTPARSPDPPADPGPDQGSEEEITWEGLDLSDDDLDMSWE